MKLFSGRLLILRSMIIIGLLMLTHGIEGKGYCHIKNRAMAITDPTLQLIHRARLIHNQPGVNSQEPNYVLAQKDDFQESAFLNKAINIQKCYNLLGENSDGTYFNSDVSPEKLYTLYGVTLLDDNCIGREGNECYCTNTQQIGICLKPTGGEFPVCNCNTPYTYEEEQKIFKEKRESGALKTDDACRGKHPQEACICSNSKKAGICNISKKAPGMEKNTLYCHCD